MLAGLSSGAVVVVGIVLMLLGVVTLAFGVAGGIAKMIKDLRRTPAEALEVDPIASLEKLLKALTALLKTLIIAPGWLALVVVGFGLVGFGAWLLGTA
jgi:hypothetical protein